MAQIPRIRVLSLGLFLSILSILAIPSPCWGDSFYFYNSFGPNFAHNPEVGCVFTGNSTPHGQTMACATPFQLSYPVYVDKIVLPLALIGGANSFQAALHADQGGLPGTVLETWTLNGAMQPAAYLPTPIPSYLVFLNSTTIPLLQPNVQYWISIQAGGSDTWASWFEGYPSYAGPYWVNINSTGWSIAADWRAPALAVHGTSATPIPEPTTIVLLATGLAALCSLRRTGHR